MHRHDQPVAQIVWPRELIRPPKLLFRAYTAHYHTLLAQRNLHKLPPYKNKAERN